MSSFEANAPVAAVAPPSEEDARTRSRLLRAAVNVFDRKGYAAASVREIVQLAGVAKPALYYHFGSKERLLVAILEEAAREFGAVLTRAVERPGATRERLIALCEDVNSLFQEHIPVVRVAHAVYHGPNEGTPAFDCTVFDRSLTQALETIVADGLAAGEVRPAVPTDVAMAVTGVLAVCAARQLHQELSPPVSLHKLLAIVFDGVLTDSRDQGEARQ